MLSMFKKYFDRVVILGLGCCHSLSSLRSKFLYTIHNFSASMPYVIYVMQHEFKNVSTTGEVYIK